MKWSEPICNADRRGGFELSGEWCTFSCTEAESLMVDSGRGIFSALVGSGGGDEGIEDRSSKYIGGQAIVIGSEQLKTYSFAARGSDTWLLAGLR